jgi:hypothetical protein
MRRIAAIFREGALAKNILPSAVVAVFFWRVVICVHSYGNPLAGLLCFSENIIRRALEMKEPVKNWNLVWLLEDQVYIARGLRVMRSTDGARVSWIIFSFQ